MIHPDKVVIETKNKKIMHFEINDLVDDKDRNEILKGLREYNLSKLG